MCHIHSFIHTIPYITYIQIYTNIYLQAYTSICTHMYISRHTTHRLTWTHTNMYSCKHRHTCIYVSTHLNVHPFAHAYVGTSIQTMFLIDLAGTECYSAVLYDCFLDVERENHHIHKTCSISSMYMLYVRKQVAH